MGILYKTVATPIGDVDVAYFQDQYTDYVPDLPASSGYTATITGTSQKTNSSDVTTYERYYALIAEPGTRVTFKHYGTSVNGSLSLSIAGVGLFSVGRADYNYSGASVTFTVPPAGVLYTIEANYGSNSISGNKYNETYTIIQSKDNTTEINSLKSQVSSLQTQLSNANSTISSNNNTISSLQSQLNTANGTISSLQGQLGTANNTITSLRSELSTANSTISSLQGQLATANATIVNLQGQLDAANATITERDAQISDLIIDIENLNHEIELLKKTIVENENTIASQVLVISDLNSQIAQLTNTNTQLNATIVQLNTTIDRLELEKTQLEADITRLNQEKNALIADYTSQISDLNNTINELTRRIALLESQINNSSSSSSQLLEKLNIAERELDRLNNEILTRIQQIESKLDVTSNGTTNNSMSIEEMKSSLIRDITAALGTPRFGIMPLPLAKQALAVSGELLSDANTGHMYFKNGNRLISKTTELEGEINNIKDFDKSSWVAISVDSDNYRQFIEATNVNSNANGTISSTNKIISMNKMKIRYNPLSIYTISVRTGEGQVTRAYFQDTNGNKFDCVLRSSNGNDSIYRLETSSIGNIDVFPVIELSAVNSTVKNILVYKAMAKEIDDADDNNFGGTNIDSTLIGSSTILNADKTFTLNSSHPVRVTIPNDSLKNGMYTLVLRVRGNSNLVFTAKTIFDGVLYETKQLDFSKIAVVAGGKTGFAEMSVPIFNGTPNYIEITATTTANVIVDYFLLSLMDFDRYNFYTKDEINAKDIPTGKTTNSGNNYTLTTTLVTQYTDALLCKIKINANSTEVCTFRCNNLDYKYIVDANGNKVKNLKAGIWYHVCYNVETGNFILLGKGGGGDVLPSEVIVNKKFTNDNGEFIGTMPNNAAYTNAVNVANSGSNIYTRIPKGGYLNPTSSGYPEIIIPHSAIGNAIGINPGVILEGNNILGFNGTAKPFNVNTDMSLSVPLVGQGQYTATGGYSTVFRLVGIIGSTAYLLTDLFAGSGDNRTATWATFDLNTLVLTKQKVFNVVSEVTNAYSPVGIKDNIIYYLGRRFDLQFNEIIEYGRRYYLTADKKNVFIETYGGIIVDNVSYTISPIVEEVKWYDDYYRILFGDYIIIYTIDKSAMSKRMYLYNYKTRSSTMLPFGAKPYISSAPFYNAMEDCYYIKASYSQSGSSTTYYHDMAAKIYRNGSNSLLFNYTSRESSEEFIKIYDQVNSTATPIYSEMLGTGFMKNGKYIFHGIPKGYTFAVDNYMYVFTDNMSYSNNPIYKYKF